LCEAGRLGLAAQRLEFTARRFGAFDERVESWNVGRCWRLRHRNNASRIRNVRKEAREHRLGPRAVGGGERTIGVHVQHLTVRTQPIEPRGISGRLALREDIRELAQPI
jgi:hypothetical protein